MREISTSIEVQLGWVHLFLNAINQLIIFEMDAPSDDHLFRTPSVRYDFEKTNWSMMFNTFHIAKTIFADGTDPDDFGERLLSAMVVACAASTPLVRPTAAKGQPWYSRSRVDRQRGFLLPNGTRPVRLAQPPL